MAGSGWNARRGRSCGHRKASCCRGPRFRCGRRSALGRLRSRDRSSRHPATVYLYLVATRSTSVLLRIPCYRRSRTPQPLAQPLFMQASGHLDGHGPCPIVKSESPAVLISLRADASAHMDRPLVSLVITKSAESACLDGAELLRRFA